MPSPGSEPGRARNSRGSLVMEHAKAKGAKTESGWKPSKVTNGLLYSTSYGRSTRFSAALSPVSGRSLKQRRCHLKVGCVEALAEPGVDIGE